MDTIGDDPEDPVIGCCVSAGYRGNIGAISWPDRHALPKPRPTCMAGVQCR